MLPKHFYAMAKGYLTKEYKLSADMRKAAFLSILPFADKKHGFSFQKFCDDFWPLTLDEEFIAEAEVVAVSPLANLSPEERQREFVKIMHAHNPKRYNQSEEKK